jgi:hypothetical protein
MAGAVVLIGAFTFGAYRSTDMQIGDLFEGQSDLHVSQEQNFVDNVQVYGHAPQFTAFLLEELDLQPGLAGRATILPSILYPIPVLGKDFRASSGVFIYNQLIYGDPDVVDQIIAYDAELFMNFHFPGVIVGYLLLGAVMGYLQKRFMMASEPITSYCWLVLAFWTAFPGSLPVLSQMCVYSFWPIYGFAFLQNVYAWLLDVRPANLSEKESWATS